METSWDSVMTHLVGYSLKLILQRDHTWPSDRVGGEIAKNTVYTLSLSSLNRDPCGNSTQHQLLTTLGPVIGLDLILQTYYI